MKVLITGSTAQQASFRAAVRVPTFASMMAEALSRNGDEVDFVEPSFKYTKQYLSIYDVVLVGIAPPTSIAANKVYPAFAMAQRAKELGNLAIFIDAPEPFKIMASLKSVSTGASNLLKPFYEKRKEFKEFKSDETSRAEVFAFNEFLNSESWPITVYPSLPWSSHLSLLSSIPNLESDSLFGVNLDYQIIEDVKAHPKLGVQSDYWTVDYQKSKWTEQVSLTVRNEVKSVRSSPWADQNEIEERINNSIGTLISVHRSDEAWWSPFIAKSLALKKPVVTDWRYTNKLGPSWNLLASTVEELSPIQSQALAESQISSYQESIEGGRENLLKAIAKATSQVAFART